MKPVMPHSRLLASVLLSGGLASFGLLGGLGIQAVREQLVAFTPLFVALPAMNAMAGDYANLIASHVGDPEAYSQRVKKLLISLLISLPISAVGVTGMSLFIAWLQEYELSQSVALEYFKLISLSLIAVMSFTVLGVLAIRKLLLRRHVNNDDVLIPTANSLASILMLASFAIMTLILR